MRVDEIEEVKKFLLMPIECTTENSMVFVHGDKIYSSQQYRGMDPDMSDIAIRFYEIIYMEALKGKILLDGSQLKSKQFCGDTMISMFSVKRYGIDKDKWNNVHRCLANFWILPMPVGHTSPRMSYSINGEVKKYAELIALSKSNSTIRDDMYSFVEFVKNNQCAIAKMYPDYWNVFGDGFEEKHYISEVYKDSTDKGIKFDEVYSKIELRAEKIAQNDYVRKELLSLKESIMK